MLIAIKSKFRCTRVQNIVAAINGAVGFAAIRGKKR